MSTAHFHPAAISVKTTTQMPLRVLTYLVVVLRGYGNIMLACKNFEGQHVWHNRGSLPQDSQARMAG